MNASEVEFAKNGCLHIANYLNEIEVQTLIEEANCLKIKGKVFRSSESHTIYQEEIDSSFPLNHPRNLLQQSCKFIIDYSEIEETSLLKSIYNRPEIRQIIQKCIGVSEVFMSGCKYNAAYYNFYDEGDGLGWHFDRSAFGVNIILQNPKDGGQFEYNFSTRTDANDFSYSKVNSIISNNQHFNELGCNVHIPSEDLRVITPEVQPGSLIIFAGQRSLHRVAPVIAGPPRINAILTYELEPNQKPNAYSLRKFFGKI